MNQLSKTNSLRSATLEYAQSIAVPPYDESAIRSRVRPATLRSKWRRSMLALAAAAVVVFLVLDGPNVLARVENMFHVFVTVNGKMVPAKVNSVTLDQARRDMQFAVIAPAGLPANLQVRDISEVVPPAGDSGAGLVTFTYDTPRGWLTITETRDRRSGTAGGSKIAIDMSPDAASPSQMRVLFKKLQGMAPSQLHASLHNRSGLTIVTPVVWTARGTTIVLAVPAGTLTSTQIALVERSMR